MSNILCDQSITGALTVSGASTFGGTVTINPDANSQIILGDGGTNASIIFAGAGDDLYLGGGNSSNMRIFNGTSVQFYGLIKLNAILTKRSMGSYFIFLKLQLNFTPH